MNIIQRDLKNIPEEYYDRFIDSLNQLEFGELNTNIEKSKQLIALGDVYEIKRFGFRLVYRFLSSDTSIISPLLRNLNMSEEELFQRLSGSISSNISFFDQSLSFIYQYLDEKNDYKIK